MGDAVTPMFMKRIRFSWQEHESAAWTIGEGGQREGEPDFSHRCSVARIPFPVVMWWQWTVKVSSDGVSFRARGYAESMDDGKAACERAVHTLALGIAAHCKEQHE
jgi:hypothetical protein